MQSGCLFTIVSGDNGDSCTQALLQIAAAGAELEKNPGLRAIVGIAANSAEARRQIWTNVFNRDGATFPCPSKSSATTVPQPREQRRPLTESTLTQPSVDTRCSVSSMAC